METMAQKKPRSRRSFTPEFMAEIVQRCLPGERGGARPTAAGEPPAAGRRGPAEASDDLLREGDPVKLDPFIEAEEVAGRGVKNACELFEVSRSAYYSRRRGRPLCPAGL